MNLRHITSSLRVGSSRTRLALRVAMWGMAISMTVITLSQLIVAGFRSTIEEKLVSLIGYANVEQNNPIFVTSDMMELDDQQILSINEIIAPQRVQAVVEAQVVAQNRSNTIGLLVVGTQNDTLNADEIRLSRSSARLLDVEVGSQIDVTIFIDKPRRYTLNVSEIYSSDIVEMESALAYVSIEAARTFSMIDSGYVSYYRIKDAAPLVPLRAMAEEEGLQIKTAQERAPHVYSWLSMIDQNMTLILIIMIVVAIINVVTATLIAVVDNMSKIATLRALGMRSATVRSLFVVMMSRYVIIGAIAGLACGLLLGAVQSYTGVIALDSASYFLSQIPIGFDFLPIAIYTVLTIVVVILSVLLPVTIISKLSIASTIKYE